MRIAHVVVTDAFAGTERYVAEVSARTASLGHEVVVLGGAEAPMVEAAGDTVGWVPASTPLRAVRALRRAGRFDIVHAHLTHAEAAAVLTRPFHRGAVIATRHIAHPRGSTPLGRCLAPLIARGLSAELAISEYVAHEVGLPTECVLHNGVRNSANLWRPESHTVVMAHRLEPEKDSVTGLRAWAASGLANQGWRLLVAGDGSQRAELEALVRQETIEGVDFLGQIADMQSLFSTTGILLATSRVDGLGLTVLEGMAAGIPIAASAAAGHRETAGRIVGGSGFAPGDVAAASRLLEQLVADPHHRATVGNAGRSLQQAEFTLDQHVDRLLHRYVQARCRPSS